MSSLVVLVPGNFVLPELVVSLTPIGCVVAKFVRGLSPLNGYDNFGRPAAADGMVTTVYETPDLT